MRKSAIAALVVLAAGAAAAPAGAQAIASHRAAYTLSLGSAKSSGISGLRGAMTIDWQEVCGGWTISQRMRFQIFDEDGESIDNDISFSSWEASDGLAYRFTMRAMRNGEVSEELRGRAELAGKGKGGKAVFTMPEEETIELSPGTIFPTEHTVEVIRRAQAGETMVSRQVFDGATLDGALEISALITSRHPPMKPANPAIDAALVGRPSWNVRMAFFKNDEQAPEPEYETSLRLLDNGVGLDFLFDYRDFSIQATLAQLEPLPKPKC